MLCATPALRQTIRRFLSQSIGLRSICRQSLIGGEERLSVATGSVLLFLARDVEVERFFSPNCVAATARHPDSVSLRKYSFWIASNPERIAIVSLGSGPTVSSLSWSDAAICGLERR